MSTDVLALVDVDRLTAWLSELGLLEGPLDVRELSGGNSNLTYLVRTGQRELIVRRRPLGPVPKGAHDMRREFRVLGALGPTGIPVPQVHGYWDDDSLVGAPAYVMDRVRGVVLHEPQDAAGVGASTAATLCDAIVDVLVDIHAVDPAAVGLADFGRPEGFVARRITRWLDQWQRSEHRDQPLVESLAATLAEQVPAVTASTLVHGDYRLGNLIVDVGDAPGVAAVLDWEMSTLGDPLTDLAHLMAYWDRQRGHVTHPSQLIAELPGFVPSAALAERYAQRSGRSTEAIDFYLAFEHWRAAIIKEGIFSRSVRQGTPDEMIGDSVAAHLAVAAEILAGTGPPHTEPANSDTAKTKPAKTNPEGT
jgi:aminoglycoside phosphotransferase (APT) family kinase protein